MMMEVCGGTIRVMMKVHDTTSRMMNDGGEWRSQSYDESCGATEIILIR